jgi:hypothetical protein
MAKVVLLMQNRHGPRGLPPCPLPRGPATIHVGAEGSPRCLSDAHRPSFHLPARTRNVSHNVSYLVYCLSVDPRNSRKDIPHFSAPVAPWRQPSGAPALCRASAFPCRRDGALPLLRGVFPRAGCLPCGSVIAAGTAYGLDHAGQTVMLTGGLTECGGAGPRD